MSRIRFRATLPDEPDHGCAFCGGKVPSGAEDMITLFLGDPGGAYGTVWAHRECLASRVQPRTAELVAKVPSGDFLSKWLKRTKPPA